MCKIFVKITHDRLQSISWFTTLQLPYIQLSEARVQVCKVFVVSHEKSQDLFRRCQVVSSLRVTDDAVA